MVDYSPLGDCIFNVVFVIDLGIGSVPDSCHPFFFFCDIKIEFVFVSREIRSGPVARRKRVKVYADYRRVDIADSK